MVLQLFRREALVMIQKTVRMHLAKKKHRPRIKALVNIKALSGPFRGEKHISQKDKYFFSAFLVARQLREGWG